MSEGLEALFNEDKQVPAQSQEPAKADERPRDENGRFAPVQAAPTPDPVPAPTPAPTPEPVVAAPEPAKQEPGHVPITALLDEREKRQRLERELNELRSRQQPEPSPTFQTPEEIAAYVQREAANSAWSAKAEVSESIAREKHGDATVDAALEWSLAKVEQEKALLGFSPFAAEQMRQRLPIEWVVRQHKRDAMISQIGDEDLDSFVKRYATEKGLLTVATPEPATAAPAAAPTQPVAPKPTPRPSLASAPTAGGIQTVPAVAPFEATFK